MQDLFAATYLPYSAAVPMWQAGSPYGYGYMQSNPATVSRQPQVIFYAVLRLVYSRL